MPSSPHSGWGRSGHRRAVLIGGLVFAIVIGGGVAAFAEVSGSTTGYRTADVTRADIATALTVVGSVAPVNEAAPAFQVGGKVTSIAVTPGAQVTAGQTLGTLDTTALSETVSSDESTLSAAEAKLAEDEANQSGASSNSAGSSSGSSGSGTGAKTPESTTTTTPSRSGTPSGSGGSGNAGSGSGGSGTTSGSSPTVTQDQDTLTQDEATLATAQQQEAADLTQEQSDCATTGTPTEQATCESALETVSADEQQVSKDQSTVSKDEKALAQALDSGSGPSTTGNSGTSAHVATEDALVSSTGNSGSGGSTPTGGGSGSSSGDTDTPQQIASDQAAIDTAQADLTEAQQSLTEATLTSPISGTVVSVGINVGDTVSAGSSTEIITIQGTNSYEIEATLDSSQIPSVKVGQAASIEVDGVDGNIDGTVSQVGPVQSSSSGYSYPVIVALPATAASAMHTGSTGDVTITTGTVSNVVAVPTSAVQTLGARAYVEQITKGELTRKFITTGMVGNTYTQVDSGLSPGQSIVLADYAEAVPSSSSDTTNLGNLLGGGGGAGGFFGGGAFPGGGGNFRISRLGGGGGGFAGG